MHGRASEGPLHGDRALFLTSIARRTRYERKRPGGQVLYRSGRGWRLDSTPDDAALVMKLRGRFKRISA
ncbi:MAG: hypothetical protein ACREM3_09890 [Candidatus Rokuibacteriota bacterium]